VHPDKNPGQEARMAFEALNQAHRALKDPNTLVSQADGPRSLVGRLVVLARLPRAAHRAFSSLLCVATQETILREQVGKARSRRDEAEGRATLGERVALNAQQKEQAKELRRTEGEALHAEVMRQMRERQERAKRKKESGSKSRYRRGGSGSGSDGEGSDGGDGGAAAPGAPVQDGSDGDDEARQRRVAAAKRRQQQQQKKLRAM
jgi:DnaJ family protein C protein 8